MKKYLEKPFEYLLRKRTGEKYEDSVVKNWYKARAYVLDKLKDIALKPNDKKRLRVIVTDVDDDNTRPLMLSVVRQVALSAHFVNYNEENQNNKTILSIVTKKEETIANKLIEEEYLCNLPIYSNCLISGVKNDDSVVDVDIEVELVLEKPQKDNQNKEDVFVDMSAAEIEMFCNSKIEDDIYCIDTRKAQYADRMYNLGAEIDNLPYEDIHSVKRYAMALDVFQYIKIKEEVSQMVKEKEWGDKENQSTVLKSMSNILCADCFITRYNSIRKCWENGKMTEKESWEKYHDALCKTEHARWVVEKLVLGYRPLDQNERLADEEYMSKMGRKKQQQKRKELKDNWRSPAHIDLCTFANLRRIDPDNMKYDSFLMLGIPEILKQVDELPKKQKNGSK